MWVLATGERKARSQPQICHQEADLTFDAAIQEFLAVALLSAHAKSRVSQ
jgi:hypothetical protein